MGVGLVKTAGQSGSCVLQRPADGVLGRVCLCQKLGLVHPDLRTSDAAEHASFGSSSLPILMSRLRTNGTIPEPPFSCETVVATAGHMLANHGVPNVLGNQAGLSAFCP